MKIKKYTFQNIYLITTYRCNWKCDFCLFRFKKEEECSIDTILKKLTYSILDSPKKVYIKITGGEPFLRPVLLRAVFDTCEQYKDKIYKIGIGTNGSLPIPSFFKDITIPTYIFLSRHAMIDKLPTPQKLFYGNNNKSISFRINCNMIKGEIDSLNKIKLYIKQKVETYGVTHFCFRELSKVNIDATSMYPKHVYDYIEYYTENLITFSTIKQQLNADFQFEETRVNGNYYDTNRWYWYYDNGQKISVKFRSIDEKRLLEFNDNNPDVIDEYVIHPDGTLTGCWDKDRKIIIGGE
jgi:organic radical activating enzyme